MSLREVILAIDGLREKDKYHHDLLRRATLIISCTGFGGKEVVKKFEKMWPSGEQSEKPSIRDRAVKQLQRFKELDEQMADKKLVKSKLDARGS